MHAFVVLSAFIIFRKISHEMLTKYCRLNVRLTQTYRNLQTVHTEAFSMWFILLQALTVWERILLTATRTNSACEFAQTAKILHSIFLNR